MATSFAVAQDAGDDQVVSGPGVSPGGGSPYDGRFAASTYRFDSGTATGGFGSTASTYDAVWITRFDAVGGADAITSVTTPFAYTAVGTTATIYIWEDPNDDGNPSDKVLIATVPVDVQSQCNCATPLFNVFTIPQPVPVRGSFFVGFKVPGKNGEFPALYEATTPYAANRSFGRMITSGFDPVASPFIAYGTPAAPVTWFIRANGSNSGFTYQGSLNVEGAAYTGNADLIATIYDAESGGAAMSPAFAIAGVAVDKGLFSVRIPADASSFDPGADRWLELGVKRAGESGYTTLVPRQRITSVPTALAAARVDWSGLTNIPATLPPWNQVSGGIAYTAGRVGIGTTSPSDTLHVLGTALFSGPTHGGRIVTTDFVVGTGGAQLLGIATGNNGGPQFRFLTSSSAANFIDVGQNGNGDFVVEGNDNPRLTVTNAGNVGIGNPSPATLLHIGSYSTGPNALRIAAAGAKTGSLQFRYFSDNYGWNIDSVDDNVVNPTGLYIRSAFNSATYTDRVFISPFSGNVGIGTTNAADRLTIMGGALSFANPTSTQPYVGLEYDAASDAMRFRTNVGSTVLNGTAMQINRASGNVGIGTTNITQKLTVNGNVLANNVVVPSSIRFKDHVTPLNDALDGLLKLDGVRFDWKPEYAATRAGREHDVGFVAEDVEKVFPELVFRDAEGNVTGMDYSRLTAVAVAAIKEQQARFEADKAAKQREIDELKARLERLERLLTTQPEADAASK